MYLEKAQLCHPLEFKKPEGVLGVDWHVFDDHVEIDKNVNVHDNGTFSLNARPVGDVRVLLLDD